MQREYKYTRLLSLLAFGSLAVSVALYLDFASSPKLTPDLVPAPVARVPDEERPSPSEPPRLSRSEPSRPPKAERSEPPRPSYEEPSDLNPFDLDPSYFNPLPEHDPSPTPEPRPTPSEPASYNERVAVELRKAWNEMKEGRIVYPPVLSMNQGRPEEVVVRIAAESDTAIPEARGMVIEPLKVSGSMSAYLEGAEGDFEIDQRSSTQQGLVGPLTSWKWMVTPLKAGTLPLTLRVVATIRLSPDVEEETDILVKESQIEVEVDRIWSAKRLVEKHWEWFAGGPLLGGIGWLAAWSRKAKKHKAAGF